MRAFFRRFSRGCYTFDDFYDNDPRASISLGEALSNDTLFMNMLSTNLIGAISSDSQLPQIVLKTRLLLQHFSLAAIKLQRTIDNALSTFRCATHTDSTQMLLYEGDDDTTNATDLNYEGEDFDEGCNSTILAYANIPNIKRFRMIARLAEIGIAIEAFLLVLVIANTIMLSTLLLQTKDHLSTATILFIFNILCSNVLFTASFLCLFSDLLDEKPFGQLSDESLEGWISPSLAIAETLNTHLFAGSDFNRHVIQETLYSLAQNGSLLGLTNLLILVLVVIHRSMEGKAIHLSKICVVTVFSLVWLFLFVTHIVFSALQFTAIHSIDEMFTRLALSRDSFDCASKAVSEYVEIGEHCDRVAPFHNFGVYLLRGHTFFTVTFLIFSLIVFMTTMGCHWKVRKQHHLLVNGARDQAPQQRRETLFNTLLLSIGAYFVSVAGQTFIEIAVFCVHNRDDVAEKAQWYQLARIAAFTDPLFNPLLVSVRTPALRRKIRCYVRYMSSLLALICCPWRRHLHLSVKRTKARTSSTTGTADSSNSHRTVATHSDELTLKFLCAQQVVRTSSMCGRSVTSQTHNSVV
uniref:G-protein coupled receptors family 1 profile domain-containing protein n=1 Tax=Parascaris univalens TaxID=6257 RepID=A0A915AAQ7_PARUN